MLTADQERWVESLSDRLVSIVPYDPRTEELFAKVREKIHALLGSEAIVEHTGASSFGISGQDEIDISIVANKEQFSTYIPKLEKVFGPVRSQYVDRARFEVREDGKKIDLKIIDVDHPNYLEGKAFEQYLKNHPDDLERYRILKEESASLTTREYYRRKIEFINEILAKA
ncbi:MAG TPA: GrpB family protein [Candidatus Paceibacterota bacterium]